MNVINGTPICDGFDDCGIFDLQCCQPTQISQQADCSIKIYIDLFSALGLAEHIQVVRVNTASQLLSLNSDHLLDGTTLASTASKIVSATSTTFVISSWHVCSELF